MKICEYCGSLCSDNETICASCGASSFKNKCNNCGNVFKDGAFCPVCGVAVGQRPRRCPFCKTDYYTRACPTCGFVPKIPGSEPEVRMASQETPAQKRNTILWVLGWIFMPQVAGTVLAAKSKRLPGWAKALIITGIWLLTIAIYAAD